MKGHVSLKIRDKNTGVVKFSTEADNFITEAVEKVITADIARLRANGSSTRLRIKDSLAEDLFGGIMLFNEPIDTTHITPSADECCHMIGNANQNQNPQSNAHRGSLVSSVITQNSAEFNYRFDTNAANGTISAICLTSNIGGALGCLIIDRDDSEISNSFLDYLDLDNNNMDELNLKDTAFQFTAYDSETGEISLIWSNEDSVAVLSNNTLTVYKTHTLTREDDDYIFDKFTADLRQIYNTDIKYNEPQNSNRNLIVTKETVAIKASSYNYTPIDSPLTSKGYAGITYEDSDNGDYILELLSCTATNMSLRKVNISAISAAIKSEYTSRGISVQEDIPSVGHRTILSVDDNIIFLVGKYANTPSDFFKVYVLKSDGTYVVCNLDNNDNLFKTLIDVTDREFTGVLLEEYGYDNNIFNIVKILDEVYLVANGYYFLLRFNQQTPLLYTRPHYYMKDAYNHFGTILKDSLSDEPYFRGLGRSTQTPDYSPYIWTDYGLSLNPLMMNYLATICNLETPVVKTSSDVLDITYTLTEVTNNNQ